MKEMIAIIEDDQDILNLVSLHLKRANFEVREFQDSKSFREFIENTTPDLLILDLMLPDADGIDVCKFLKSDDRYSSILIIMLTAKAEETDKVIGLELGADDYVTKPFSPRELIARVKAVLRRHDKKDKKNRIIIGDLLVIDLKKHEVFVNSKKIDLTTTEFRVLQILSEKKGWVFSRDKILSYLWGDEKIVLDRTVDVHIRNLREKLGSACKLIKNIRGVGYKLEE